MFEPILGLLGTFHQIMGIRVGPRLVFHEEIEYHVLSGQLNGSMRSQWDFASLL